MRSLTFICDPSALEYPFFAATGGVNGHDLPLGIHSILPQSGCHFIYIFKISRKNTSSPCLNSLVWRLVLRDFLIADVTVLQHSVSQKLEVVVETLVIFSHYLYF